MKRKFISILFSVAITAFTAAGLTVSAEDYPAETSIEPTETMFIETPDIETEITENIVDVNEIIDTAIKKDKTDIQDSSEPDYYNDDFYDTSGNASLITSEHIIYNSEEMQFIAVTTKDGHVFYVLINYSADSGEDAVFFLNKVDDYDLYALLYANNDDEKNPITPAQAAQAAEDANSRFPNKTDKTENAELSSDAGDNTDTPTDNEQSESHINMTSIYIAVGAVIIGAVCIILIKLIKKPKKKIEIPESDDDDINFYNDNEIDEDEE